MVTSMPAILMYVRMIPYSSHVNCLIYRVIALQTSSSQPKVGNTNHHCATPLPKLLGPLVRTLVDFWRLIWQEKPQAIVMVTNLKEGNKTKCEQYWPLLDRRSTEIGPFLVILQDENVFPEYTVRLLSVQVMALGGA